MDTLQICFAEGAWPRVIEEDVLRLDSEVEDDEAAATLGRLSSQLVDRLPWVEDPDDPRSCEDRVDEALQIDARGYALELRLRRRLGVRHPNAEYQFTRRYWAAAPQDRVGYILEYLRSRPNGTAAIEGLAQAYRQRCVREQVGERGNRTRGRTVASEKSRPAPKL